MYEMKNHSKEYLETNGFKYSRVFSDSESTCYYKRVPVFKYGIYILLTAEIRVEVETGITWIDVFDGASGRSYYAGYYIRDYGDVSGVTDVIDANIEKEMRKYGIKEINEDAISKDDTNQIHRKRRYEKSQLHRKRTPRRMDRSESGENSTNEGGGVQADSLGSSNEAS